MDHFPAAFLPSNETMGYNGLDINQVTNLKCTYSQDALGPKKLVSIGISESFWGLKGET